MRKICFILPSLGGGGAERVALNLLNNINLNKYYLSVILIHEKGEYFKELRKDVNFKILESKSTKKAILKIKLELNKLNPDIVLTFSTNLNIIVGLFIAPFFKNKTIFISREINILSQIKLNIIKKILLKIAYRNSKKIISQSDDMTRDLKTYLKINENKIYKISNPIDCKKIKEKLNEKNPFEKTESLNILCVGRLVEQKGFDLLIKNFSKLKNSKYVLNILGVGPQKEILEELCNKLNIQEKVKFLGFKENPYIYMKYAEIFILSSRYEGFPNVLLEAGYCGLYSIVNNCKGGITEIIDDKNSGKIIDIEEFEELNLALLEYQKKKISKEKISKNIESKYSSELIIKEYEKIFDEI